MISIKTCVALVLFVVALTSGNSFCPNAEWQFLLFPEQSQSDDLVCKKLQAAGIDDPYGYWQEHVVAKFVAAESRICDRDSLYRSVWRNMLLRFMGEIKDKIRSTGFESAQSQLQMLSEGRLSFVMLPLPLPLQDMIDQKACFLADPQRASLVSKIKIMLDEGIDWKCINEYLRGHLKRLCFLAGQKGSVSALSDQCIGSLLPWPNSVSNVPARIIDYELHRSTDGPIPFSNLRTVFQKIIDGLEPTVNIRDVPDHFKRGPDHFKRGPDHFKRGNVGCACCLVEKLTLYGSPCSCDRGLLLCSECLEHHTLNIIRQLDITMADDLNSVILNVALQIPNCPFCRKPYYDDKNLRELRDALPIVKRKAIVIQTLTRLLDPIPEEIVELLIESDDTYSSVITHSPYGNFLPKNYIALQIFEYDVRMKEGIAAPFADTAIWKRS